MAEPQPRARSGTRRSPGTRRRRPRAARPRRTGPDGTSPGPSRSGAGTPLQGQPPPPRSYSGAEPPRAPPASRDRAWGSKTGQAAVPQHRSLAPSTHFNLEPCLNTPHTPHLCTRSPTAPRPSPGRGVRDPPQHPQSQPGQPCGRGSRRAGGCPTAGPHTSASCAQRCSPSTWNYALQTWDVQNLNGADPPAGNSSGQLPTSPGHSPPMLQGPGLDFPLGPWWDHPILSQRAATTGHHLTPLRAQLLERGSRFPPVGFNI